MYTHTRRERGRGREKGGLRHTLLAQLQPTIWGRISVIAAQLAPTHFLYQLCADIVVAVIQTAIIFPVADALHYRQEAIIQPGRLLLIYSQVKQPVANISHFKSTKTPLQNMCQQNVLDTDDQPQGLH